MSVRRLGAGLVAAALITPALAACASETGTAGSTPSPTVTASGTASPSGAPVAGDAKQALLDSTKEISNGNFRFTSPVPARRRRGWCTSRARARR